MARTTYILRDGILVEKYLAAPPSGVFHVISDAMDPVAHPCTGRIMDSKSRFRAVTRAHGCVEMGDQAPTRERPRDYDSRGLREDIRRAIANPDRRPAMGEHHLRRIERWA